MVRSGEVLVIMGTIMVLAGRWALAKTSEVSSGVTGKTSEVYALAFTNNRLLIQLMIR